MITRFLSLFSIVLFIVSLGCSSAAQMPEDPLGQARMLIDAGQTDMARETIVKYLSVGGAQTEYAEYLLTLTTFSDPDPDAARRSVDDLRRRFPESRFAPMSLFRLGQYYRVNLRDADRAVSVYSQFLQVYPQDPLASEAQMYLASALIDAGQYDRAIAAIHQARAMYAYDPEEKNMLNGLLDFAKQSAGQTPSSGSVVIEAKPPAAPPESKQGTTRESLPSPPAPIAKPVTTAPIRPDLEYQTAESFPDGIPPPEPPEPPEKSAPIEEPSVGVAPTDEAEPAPESAVPEPYVIMDFRNAEIRDVLQTVSEDLGVRFLQEVAIDGKITIQQRPRLLAKTQALMALTAALKSRGLEVVRAGNDVYRVTAPFAARPSADSAAAPSPMDTPIAERIRIADAAVVRKIRPETPGPDRPARPAFFDVADEWLKVYPLNAAAAERLSEFLNRVLEKEIARITEGATRPGTAFINADLMTNRIVVMGPRSFHDAVEPLIRKLDYAGFSEFHVQVIRLRFANAADLTRKLETIVSWDNARSGSDQPRILIQADPQLNALILSSASQQLIRMFTDLASALDQMPPPDRFLKPPEIKSLDGQDFIEK